jgi:hypothetical protein
MDQKRNFVKTMLFPKLDRYLLFLCILAEAERFLTGFFMSTMGIAGITTGLTEDLLAAFANVSNNATLLVTCAFR